MSNTRQHCIMLVENEPSIVLLIQRAISKIERNIHLQTFSDGEQAVNYLKKIVYYTYTNTENYLLPDLVFTDIKTPRISGMELLAWIKKQPEIAYLPVVILSSSGYLEDMNQVNNLGASSYVIKPSSASEWVEIMRKIFTFLTSEQSALCCPRLT